MQALYGRNSESPGGGDRAGHARGLLLHRLRGGADRDQVHGPGDGAVRRLPRQRLRAVADPRPEERCRTSTVRFRTDPEGFFPYLRDQATLARPWVRPGTPGLEHRIGGLEKQDVTGNISYDPDNHDHMVRTPRGEGAPGGPGDPADHASTARPTGDLLVVGWGGTYGTITAAVEEAQAAGKSVASDPPPAPQPAAARSRPDPAPVPPGARAGDQQRPARPRPAGGVPRRRGGFNRVRGVPLASAGHRRRDQPAGRGQLMSTDDERTQAPRSTRRRTSSPTRTCAGARAAGTTRSCAPSRR